MCLRSRVYKIIIYIIYRYSFMKKSGLWATLFIYRISLRGFAHGIFSFTNSNILTG